MISRYWRHLTSTLIQVPHHGSNTSSSALLIRRVDGAAALASASRYNAWRMPSYKVVQRYRQRGYRWFATPQQGQITVVFPQKGGKSIAYGIKFYRVGIISGLARPPITGRICGYFNTSWFIECRTINLSTWQTFRRLWPIIAPFKAGLIVAAVALVLNAGSDTFMLSLLKPLLDDGFGKTDRSVLLWMPLVVIGLMVLRGITSYISSYCISRVSGKVVMTMRRRLFGHMMGMPVAFFDKQSTGTLLSRITYDSEQVASSSSSALITVVREGHRLSVCS